MPRVADPTFIHGKNSVLLIDEYDLSPYFKSFDRSSSLDEADATGFGQGFKRKEVGHADASFNGSGMFSGDLEGIAVVANKFTGRSTKQALFLGHAYPKVGTPVTIGRGQVTQFNIGNQVADMVTTQINYSADGGAHSGYSLWDYSTAHGTAGATNGTAVDFGSAGSGGWVASLHVVESTLDKTIDVKIQHSSNNSTWTDLTSAAFSQIPATTEDAENLRVIRTGTTVNRYVRAVVTVGASPTGSAYIAIGFAQASDLSQ